MDISKAIKQTKFKSNYEMAMINLLYTSNWLRDRQYRIFKDYKILPQHYNVMRIVKGQHPEPVSPGYILDVMLDKGRDLTRLVDKLVRLGYLDRNTCPENRRKVDITITPRGIKMVDDVKNRIDEWMLRYNTLSENEALQLSQLLDKMRGHQ